MTLPSVFCDPPIFQAILEQRQRFVFGPETTPACAVGDRVVLREQSADGAPTGRACTAHVRYVLCDGLPAGRVIADIQLEPFCYCHDQPDGCNPEHTPGCPKTETASFPTPEAKELFDEAQALWQPIHAAGESAAILLLVQGHFTFCATRRKLRAIYREAGIPLDPPPVALTHLTTWIRTCQRLIIGPDLEENPAHP